MATSYVLTNTFHHLLDALRLYLYAQLDDFSAIVVIARR